LHGKGQVLLVLSYRANI